MKIPTFKSYKGGTLKGKWLITRKLDGVCAIIDTHNRSVLSKHGKPLYNFDELFDLYPHLSGVFEIYAGDWDKSVSLVRTQHGGKSVDITNLYHLFPPEEGLRLMSIENPEESLLNTMLTEALDRGEEGLVLYPLLPDESIDTNGKPVKVKPKVTFDVRVTEVIEGTGKYEDMLGAFMTDYGKVGTGFNDYDRLNFWLLQAPGMVGKIIEVEAMGMTKNNKFRHPVFKRVRWDKNTENLEQEVDDEEV